MKKVSPISINKNSVLWKMLEKEQERDLDKIAQEAADKARKEAIEGEKRRKEIKQAYINSLQYYDKMSFANETLRNKVSEAIRNRWLAYQEYNICDKKEKLLIKQMQDECNHDMVVEQNVSYENDVNDHNYYERKCIACFLIEKSDLLIEEYSHHRYGKRYDKLLKSQVVVLRSIINGEEYELEFNDVNLDNMAKDFKV